MMTILVGYLIIRQTRTPPPTPPQKKKNKWKRWATGYQEAWPKKGGEKYTTLRRAIARRRAAAPVTLVVPTARLHKA